MLLYKLQFIKTLCQFIANCRKDKKLTQEQLAEKLNLSKNAVSKWERGICLMDMSLLKPLSEILDVSVNDILSGEKTKKRRDLLLFHFRLLIDKQ